MNFSETYARVNAPIAPSPRLIETTLEKTRRSPFPLQRLLGIAAAAAVLLATPALAAQTETGYQLLYALSPASAQFFQPVQRSCTDSYRFHLPFDQMGHCERAGFDPETHTVFFLVTTQTMNGSKIPIGGKMTFSLDCFLSGKQALEGAAVPLNLADYAQEGETTGDFFRTGGSGNLELAEALSVLRPGAILAEPAPGLTVTAAGYADSLFHVQLCQGDARERDNHGWLWLENDAGERLAPSASAYFTNQAEGDTRLDYQEFVFDISPEDLGNYALYGDFYTASARIDGNWRITFPLENAG